MPTAWEAQVRDKIRSMQGAWLSWSQAAVPGLHHSSLCVDYRRPNTVTVNDPYLMLRIDVQLDKLGKASYLSTLHQAKRYYQVLVRADVRDKTTFVPPMGSTDSVGCRSAGKCQLGMRTWTFLDHNGDSQGRGSAGLTMAAD